jgi:hypothetical protein
VGWQQIANYLGLRVYATRQDILMRMTRIDACIALMINDGDVICVSRWGVRDISRKCPQSI